MRPRRASVLLSTAVLLFAGPALAQNPSADSIINSLRPGAGMTGGTRGIRPVGPSEAPAPSSPAAPSATPRVSTTAPVYHAPAPRAPAPQNAGTQRAGMPGAGMQGGAQPQTQTQTQAETQAPSVNLTVQFPNNSAALTPAAMHTLDELGRALSSQALATYRFRIEGHTDSLGSREHNQALSEQRAKAVVDYLASKFHLDPSRLEAVGMGDQQPLVQARANASEPRNRRVTVVNLGT